MPRSIETTDVLIVGAGPFGLALGAYLQHLGLDYLIAGDEMSFWRDHMPRGMLLRSGLDWHLDVMDEATLDAFVRETRQAGGDVLPITRDRYLEYVAWFARRKGLKVGPYKVESLDVNAEGRFVAGCGDITLEASNVVLATGFRDYAFMPPELTSLLPQGRYGHTCDVVDLEQFRDRKVVIVGGRQSAFESAALLAEAGARSVDLVYRHKTPAFVASDWSWVGPLMLRTETEPDWYRRLSEADRRELDGRFWAEGRLKLEPWLAPRIDRPNVHLWPRSRITAAADEGGRLHVILDSGEQIGADYVLLATGYKVDVHRLAFLEPGDLLERIETRDGSPVLATDLQSSQPGLYFTSIAATRDFGPFFAFTVSARCSARLIGNSLQARIDRDLSTGAV